MGYAGQVLPIPAGVSTNTCTKCHGEKPEMEFYLRTDTKARMSACKDCKRAYERSRLPEKTIFMRRWRRENPKRVQAILAKYAACHRGELRAYYKWRYLANKDRIRRHKSAYYVRNKPRIIARVKSWRRRHPDLVTAYGRAHELKRRGAPGHATPKQIQERVAMWGWRCWICRVPWEQIDHVIPIALGGSNWPANLRPICRACNMKKGMRRMVLAT